MEKEFAPYELALALKELEFDEPCFATYFGLGAWQIDCTEGALNLKNNKSSKYSILAPTYQQAFRWFREKYGLYGYPFSQMSQTNFWFKYFIQQEWKDQITSDGFITHKEAELECLKKLIQIVKEK